MLPQEENVFGVYKFGKCNFLPEQQMEVEPISNGSSANLSPLQTACLLTIHILKTLFHSRNRSAVHYIISLAENVNAKYAAGGSILKMLFHSRICIPLYTYTISFNTNTNII